MSQFEGSDLTCVRGERLVFAGLGFAVGPGGALLLSGPNGSGKTSLLRLMAGLIKPAVGTLTWQGQAIDDHPETHRARLGFVGHQDAIKPVLTVVENLRFWANPDPAAAAKCQSALERLGLAPLADLPARLLSAGQRRRLALARLLVSPAELWLLDEPTVGLDQESLTRLSTVIAEQRAGGGRVVVATHTPLPLPDARKLRLAGFAVPAALPANDMDLS